MHIVEQCQTDCVNVIKFVFKGNFFRVKAVSRWQQSNFGLGPGWIIC